MIADILNYSCWYIGMTGDKYSVFFNSKFPVAIKLDGGTKKNITVSGVDLRRGGDNSKY